jgi:hypothetical protein
MSIPVVISSVQLETDGFIHASGTVNGGPTVSINPIYVNNLPFDLTAAQLQLYIAVLLCVASGTTITFTSLEGTINV